MVNWSGIAAVFSAALRPTLLKPTLRVPSIASLDFEEFKKRGVVGVVVDKDNCLTKPLEDELAPSLRPAWGSLLKSFGTANVLIVSNSAGTKKDSILLQAESVSRNLLVPILVHPSPKPSRKCAVQVADHFLFQNLQAPTTLTKPVTKPAVVWSSKGRALAQPSVSPRTSLGPSESLKILVIGDRVTTDMILAKRIADLTRPIGKVETIPILTTELHAREGPGTTFMRGVENLVVGILERRDRRQRRNGDEVPDGGEVVGDFTEGAKILDERWEECVIMTTTAKQVKTVESASRFTSEMRQGWTKFVPTRIVNAFSLRSIVSGLHAVLTKAIDPWRPPPPQQIEGAYKTPLGDEYRATPLHPAQEWKTITTKAVGFAERAVDLGERVAQKGDRVFSALRRRRVAPTK